MRWHYMCRWTASRSGLVDLAHGGRQRDAGGGERETGGGTWWRAQQEAFVVLRDLGLGERVEIGKNVRPGALATEVGDALLQLLLQDEGEIREVRRQAIAARDPDSGRFRLLRRVMRARRRLVHVYGLA